MKGIFIDSNIFIAFANIRDRDHERAKWLVSQVIKGRSQPLSSDYVFDEVITTALVRTGRLDVAVKAGKIIIGSREESIPPLVRVVRVDDQIFKQAWTNFKTGKYRGLSFTDHTILAQMAKLGVEELVSFDSGFDGLTTRIS